MTSKLAFHLQKRDEGLHSGRNAQGQRVMQPDWVKIIDYPDWRNPWPDQKVLVREVLPQQYEDHLLQRGAAGAEEWWGAVWPKYRTASYAEAVETPNEPWVNDLQRAKIVGQFMRRATELAHDSGVKIAVLQLGEGNPGGNEQEHRDRVLALAEGCVNADYIGLHGYFVPPGANHPEAGFTDYHAFSYRRFYRAASEAGLKLPSCLLTEFGFDDGIRGNHQKGWQTYYANPNEYLADLIYCDQQELVKDPYLLAALVFTLEPVAPWDTFSVNGLYQAINDHVARSGGAYKPDPSPVPVPDPVDPDPEPGQIDPAVRELVQQISVGMSTMQKQVGELVKLVG